MTWEHGMTPQQRTAIEHHCRLAIETMHPRFAWGVPAAGVTCVLTVNSGYESLDMNFGGPVWHVSIMPMPKVVLARTELRRMANKVLDGVGDARLGEWEEQHRALHVRRRLTAAEQLRVGPVVDVRRTAEAITRAAPLAEAGILELVDPLVLEEELGPWS